VARTQEVADAVDAWQALLAVVGDAGRSATASAEPMDAVDAVEGLDFVMALLGDRLAHGSTHPTDTPVFIPGVTPTRKLLFDNPDADYDTALLRGDRRYRVRGTRGTSTYLAFCAYSGSIAGGETTTAVNRNDTDLAFAADGSFEVVLSRDEQPGNWIPLGSGTNTLIVRQYFLDRAREQRATYAIEEIGGQPDPPLDPARVTRSLSAAGGFVTAVVAATQQRIVDGRADPNRFTRVPGHGLYGTPDAEYLACWFTLRDDQVLVVEGAPPTAARYWGLHLANRWGQSLDHRTRTTVCNARTITCEPDGSFRVVVGATDPGGPNWLDTAGHREGWILLRRLLGDGLAIPSVSVR
jgi:hypothetical protein